MRIWELTIVAIVEKIFDLLLESKQTASILRDNYKRLSKSERRELFESLVFLGVPISIFPGEMLIDFHKDRIMDVVKLVDATLGRKGFPRRLLEDIINTLSFDEAHRIIKRKPIAIYYLRSDKLFQLIKYTLKVINELGKSELIYLKTRLERSFMNS